MVLWFGRALVELKMVKEAESIARIMRAQLKLTPRRATLASRTRVLIFYKHCQQKFNEECRKKYKNRQVKRPYQIASLLLVGGPFALLQDVLLAERRAQGVVELPGRRPRHLHGALEWCLGRHRDGY